LDLCQCVVVRLYFDSSPLFHSQFLDVDTRIKR
jgi:hypothetical protein